MDDQGQPTLPPTTQPGAPVMQFELASKPFWQRRSVLGVTLVLLVFIVLFAASYNFRAVIFGSSLRQYTLTNVAGDRYSIVFYKGSTVHQNYNFGPNKDTVLVSPPVGMGGDGLVLALGGKPNNSTAEIQQLRLNYSSCVSANFADAFTVSVRSVKFTANVCTNPTQNGIGPVEFISYFGDQQTVY